MSDRTENVTIQLDNGQQLLIKPHHTPQQILKGVKMLDAEGSYPTFLKRYGELENEKAKRPNKVTAVADSVLQGASFGFADEAVAGLNAGIGKLKGEGEFGDLYDQYHSTYQADLNESSELLSTPVRLLTEIGVPFFIVNSIVSKFLKKGIQMSANKIGKKQLRKEAKDAGLTKKEAKEWEKINELPEDTKGKVVNGIANIATKSVPLASATASLPITGALVGTGNADRGERIDGLIGGAVVGKQAIDRFSPFSQGFNPAKGIGEMLPGFNQGGQVGGKIKHRGLL